jgi:glycosyltransferase involved in cell wall biosynthesis
VNEYPERWQHPSFRAKTRHLIVDETADGIPFGLSDTTPASVPLDHVRLVLIDDYTATPENVGKWHSDCRQLLVPSQHARSVLDGLGADDVKVVPLGVDPASFRPVPKDLRRRNAKWIVPGCLDDQTFVMLHYGALQDRKGTTELVEAYRRAFGKRDKYALSSTGQP